MRRHPSTADQTALLKADLATSRSERLAALRRYEVALHEEIRALEMVHQARAAGSRAMQEAENLQGQIDGLLEALSELIPEQRQAE
jgi:hypothetical protein